VLHPSSPSKWHVDSEKLPWFDDAHSIPVSDEEDETLTYRIVDKVLIPVDTELLDEDA
jgi:hypothetical protein